VKQSKPYPSCHAQLVLRQRGSRPTNAYLCRKCAGHAGKHHDSFKLGTAQVAVTWRRVKAERKVNASSPR